MRIMITDSNQQQRRTKMTKQELIKRVKEEKITYYGETPRLWENHGKSRIYFGRDFVTIEDGEVHNRRAGKSRAITIGHDITDQINKIFNGE